MPHSAGAKWRIVPTSAQFLAIPRQKLVLVGDSLGQLILGRSRIEETTLEDMIHHCSAVSRGTHHALLVGDMPFGSYEIDPTVGVHNAVRLVKEGGVDAVKVEGGLEVVPVVTAITTVRIPTFAHLTLDHIPPTAQTEREQTTALAEAARGLEEAGACALVVVGLPSDIAGNVTKSLRAIPSIGYRSGPHCDGQLFVTPGLLGLLPAAAPTPGPYAAVGAMMKEAFAHFCADVAGGHQLQVGDIGQQKG